MDKREFVFSIFFNKVLTNPLPPFFVGQSLKRLNTNGTNYNYTDNKLYYFYLVMQRVWKKRKYNICNLFIKECHKFHIYKFNFNKFVKIIVYRWYDILLDRKYLPSWYVDTKLYDIGVFENTIYRVLK